MWRGAESAIFYILYHLNKMIKSYLKKGNITSLHRFWYRIKWFENETNVAISGLNPFPILSAFLEHDYIMYNKGGNDRKEWKVCPGRKDTISVQCMEQSTGKEWVRITSTLLALYICICNELLNTWKKHLFTPIPNSRKYVATRISLRMVLIASTSANKEGNIIFVIAMVNTRRNFSRHLITLSWSSIVHWTQSCF